MGINGSATQYIRYKRPTGDGFEDITGIPFEWGTKKIQYQHVRYYNHALSILCSIDGCARNLIEYLIVNMSRSNIVSSNNQLRKDFIAYVKKHGKISYQDITVKKAFSTLAAKKLIIPLKRGSYIVNPDYFARIEETERQKMMKRTLEMPYDKNIAVEIEKSIMDDDEFEKLLNSKININAIAGLQRENLPATGYESSGDEI